MRSCVRLVLLLFVLFLSTPTLVGVIKKSCNTTSIYSMSEEELSIVEVKAGPITFMDYEPLFIGEESHSHDSFHTLEKHDQLSASIFIPPPDRI